MSETMQRKDLSERKSPHLGTQVLGVARLPQLADAPSLWPRMILDKYDWEPHFVSGSTNAHINQHHFHVLLFHFPFTQLLSSLNF